MRGPAPSRAKTRSCKEGLYAAAPSGSVAIVAILVAVLVFHADFYAAPPSAFIEVAIPVFVPAIPIMVPVAFVLHSPVATDGTTLAIVVAVAVVAARGAVAPLIPVLLRSPIAMDLNVLAAIPVLFTRLLGLLWRVLWLHRNSLGLAGAWGRSRSRVLGK